MFDSHKCDVMEGKYGPPPDDIVECAKCHARVDVNDCTEVEHYGDSEYLCAGCNEE